VQTSGNPGSENYKHKSLFHEQKICQQLVKLFSQNECIRSTQIIL